MGQKYVVVCFYEQTGVFLYQGYEVRLRFQRQCSLHQLQQHASAVRLAQRSHLNQYQAQRLEC